jgi:TolA-binding protein
MQNRVRISKRQIKEDKFTVFMLTAKSRFMENWQFYVIAVAAAVLIVVAISYYFNAQEAKMGEAGQKFANAMAAYRGQQNQVAVVALNELVEDYGGAEIAEQATFMLGKINYEGRNYPEAVRFFERYLSEYSSNPLNRAASRGGLAACSESQGDYETAKERYLQAYEEYPSGPLAGDYRLSALRMALKTNDHETATRLVTSLEEEYEGTNLAKRAVRLFYEAGLTRPSS